MIYKLNEISKKDINIVGGKAGNLGELINNGFNVPKGFVCTNLESKNEVFNMMNKLNLNTVAVRSSAICEDGAFNSYAGQFESFLNIKKEDVIKYINKCFKSKESANIKEYIEEKNIENENTKVSAIIQDMINGDFSGVMFTKNPVNNKNQIIIEYVPGLGEKLVQGEEKPIQIILNKDTLDLVSESDNCKLISTETIIKLAKIGIEIEDNFKVPQDIEWTIKNNEIFILQTRNITSL